MTAERMVVPGVVKGGVVVPDGNAHLPEGARVDIVIAPTEIPPELRTEFDDWERLSDEAWAMIDQWEKEDAQTTPEQQAENARIYAEIEKNGIPRVRI